MAFDLNQAAVEEAVNLGATAATDLDDVLAQLTSPRIVWVMLPAGKPTDATIQTLSEK